MTASARIHTRLGLVAVLVAGLAGADWWLKPAHAAGWMIALAAMGTMWGAVALTERARPFSAYSENEVGFLMTSVTVGGFVTAAAATAVGTGQLVLDSSKTFNVAAANATDFFTAVAASGQLQKVSDLDVSSVAGANRSLSIVDSALASINGQRARFGALQSRFQSAITSLQTTSENLSAARSRITDADFASETASLTRGQILQQAGIAILAQANALPNSVLALLK